MPETKPKFDPTKAFTPAEGQEQKPKFNPNAPYTPAGTTPAPQTQQTPSQQPPTFQGLGGYGTQGQHFNNAQELQQQKSFNLPNSGYKFSPQPPPQQQQEQAPGEYTWTPTSSIDTNPIVASPGLNTTNTLANEAHEKFVNDQNQQAQKDKQKAQDYAMGVIKTSKVLSLDTNKPDWVIPAMYDAGVKTMRQMGDEFQWSKEGEYTLIKKNIDLNLMALQYQITQTQDPTQKNQLVDKYNKLYNIGNGLIDNYPDIKQKMIDQEQVNENYRNLPPVIKQLANVSNSAYNGALDLWGNIGEAEGRLTGQPENGKRFSDMMNGLKVGTPTNTEWTPLGTMDYVTSGLGSMAPYIAAYATGAGEISTGLESMGVSAGVADVTGSVLANVPLQYNQAYNEAENAGVTSEMQKNLYAVNSSLITGMLFTALPALRTVKGLGEAETLGAKEFATALAEGAPQRDAAQRGIMALTKALGKSAEGAGIMTANDLAQKVNQAITNVSTGQHNFDPTVDPVQEVKNFAINALTLIPFGAVDGWKELKKQNSLTQYSMLYAATNTEDALKQLTQLKEKGTITPEQYDRTVDLTNKLATAWQKIPSYIPMEQKLKILPTILEKTTIEQRNEQLEKQKQTTDSSFHPTIDEELNNNNTNISGLTTEIQNEVGIKPTATADEGGIPNEETTQTNETGKETQVLNKPVESVNTSEEPVENNEGSVQVKPLTKEQDDHNSIIQKIKKYNTLSKKDRSVRGVKLKREIDNAAKKLKYKLTINKTGDLQGINTKGKILRTIKPPRPKEEIQADKDRVQEVKNALSAIPNNVKEWALQYVIGGGKVDKADYERYTGAGTADLAKGVFTETGSSFDRLWEHLKGEQDAGNLNFQVTNDSHEFANEMSGVLSGYMDTDAMTRDLLTEQENYQKMQDAIAPYEVSPEEITPEHLDEAYSLTEHLDDEEVNQYLQKLHEGGPTDDVLAEMFQNKEDYEQQSTAQTEGTPEQPATTEPQSSGSPGEEGEGQTQNPERAKYGGEVDTKIAEIDAKIKEQQQARENKRNELNSKVTLFDEGKADNQLFNVDKDQSAENLQAQLKPYDDAISNLETQKQALEDGREKHISDSIERDKNQADMFNEQNKSLADRIREGKIDKGQALATIPFAPQIWNAALELVAKAVEAGESMGEAIKKGLAHLKRTDEYKALSKSDRVTLEDEFNNNALKENARTNPNKGKEVSKEEVQKILDNIEAEKGGFIQRAKELLKDNPLTKIITGTVKKFDPFVGSAKNTDSIYNDARLTSITLREKLGKMQHDNEVAAQGSHARTLFFEKMDKSDQIRFIANLERGVDMGDEGLNKLADGYRERFDKVFDQISAIKDVPYIEDYFPHFWKDPDAARKVFAKGPIQGSKSFLKARFYNDVIEGMKQGLELVSTNPEDLARLAEINANKFVMGNDLFEALKQRGLASYFKHGDQPDGWKLVDDPLFKRTSLFTKVDEDGNAEAAMKMGGYYMPEDAAELISRYTSRGLQGPVYDLIRNYNNMANQFQLGISGFHGVTTTIDSAVTANAMGIDNLLRGNVGTGLWQLAKGTTLIPNMVDVVRTGSRVIKDYRSGVINDDVSKMIIANARTGFDAVYHTNMWDNFQRAWKGGRYGEAAWRSVPAVLDLTGKPIFEYLVPRLKVGGFVKVAQNELSKLSNPTQDQVNRTIQKAWDDMDNRLGQMTYDNLFWDKTTKDVGFLMTRSLGWNLGTARAFGGAVGDIPASLKSMVKGKGISPRTAWIIALTGQTMLMGAVYNYLNTGQSPQDWKDYFYPRTGEVNADGTQKRVQFPTYMKEVFNTYNKGLTETATSKFAPAINEAVEIYQDKDFYGNHIYDPLDPAYQRGLDVLKYLGEQVEPFSFREVPGREQSTKDKIQQKVGIMPAPKQIETGKNKYALWQKIDDVNSDITDLKKKYKNKQVTADEYATRYNELVGIRAQTYNELYSTPPQSGSNAKPQQQSRKVTPVMKIKATHKIK